MRKITFQDVFHVTRCRATFVRSLKEPAFTSKSSLTYQVSADLSKNVEVEPWLTAQMNKQFGPSVQILALKKQVNHKDPMFSFVFFSSGNDEKVYEFEFSCDQEKSCFEMIAFAYALNGEYTTLLLQEICLNASMIEMELYFQRLLLELPVFRLHHITKGICLCQHTLHETI